MTKDFFAEKASTFEQNLSQVDNVEQIAQAMLAAFALEKSMRIVDFGSGTGLLLERIAPHVGSITAVDVSPAMNRQLEQKLPGLGCAVEMLAVDLENADIDGPFDGIISSMTLHHIRDVAALLKKLHALLVPGGFIAVADLDSEDGSFHSEDTGVYHNGFDRDEIAALARGAGFRNVEVTTASVIHKPQRDYPVFLLAARR